MLTRESGRWVRGFEESLGRWFMFGVINIRLKHIVREVGTILLNIVATMIILGWGKDVVA